MNVCSPSNLTDVFNDFSEAATWESSSRGFIRIITSYILLWSTSKFYPPSLLTKPTSNNRLQSSENPPYQDFYFSMLIDFILNPIQDALRGVVHFVKVNFVFFW